MYLYFICATSRLFSTRSAFTKMANYPGTKLVGVAYKLRKKMINSPSCVHVLHRTLNVVISCCCFAEDGKEMYQNVKRKCRAIVFAHLTYCFAALPLLKLRSATLVLLSRIKIQIFAFVLHEHFCSRDRVRGHNYIIW